MQFVINRGFPAELHKMTEYVETLACLHHFNEILDSTALAFVVRKHLREFLFIIAGDTVRQNMNDIAVFRHIVAGGFDASCGIRSSHKKLGNSMRLNKGGKVLTCQCVALCLGKNKV